MAIKYILTDIEGTTTSVSFVYDVLFPYFSKHLAQYFAQNRANEEVQAVVEAVRQTLLEEEGRAGVDEQGVLQQLQHWTKTDRKHPALKTLQGLVWKQGYESGEIKGHIYEDVRPCLENWQKAGYQMGVYSSGSVAAQKLIFGQSVAGNLLPFFSHHFDTKIGHKREATSYKNIAKAIGQNPSEILFLSDVGAELAAAQSQGYQFLQLLREGTQPDPAYKGVSDFTQINLQAF